MSGGGQQQPGDTLHESGIGWAIMLAIFAVLIWLFWYFFHTEVRELVRWIRYSEMWLVSWFIEDDYMITLNNGQQVPFEVGFEQTPKYRKENLQYAHLAMFSDMAMQPLRIPIVVLLGAGALWCMFSGPGTGYRQRMSIQTLINRQAPNFPAIWPFMKFDPSAQPTRPPGAPVPAELPDFAEALGPEEWLAYNSINPKGGVLEEEVTSAAFIKQLGNPWRGAKQLDDYKQVLLAAFCLKAGRKRVESEDLLGRLAKCWSLNGGLKLSKDPKLLRDAQKVLKDKKVAGPTLSNANRHAYETTALLRALQFAREEGGVLAPSLFVWMRSYDRNLWYPLNNLGRQSYHMEALGAMSHFKAEKLTQRPIPVPKVQHAFETIQEYMKSARARPIPQLDYSKSQKRGVKKAV